MIPLNDFQGLSLTGPKEYEGIPRNVVQSLYNKALQLRFTRPTPGSLIRATRTNLEAEVVSAILEGALRLLPRDVDLIEDALRLEKEREKARKANEAERAFVNRLLSLYHALLGEEEQRRRIRAIRDAGTQPSITSTPDVRFSKPTILCDKTCHWVEFKNNFGFRSNPFIAPKNKKQLSRYASELGPGMVVFKLGYESNHLQLSGVHCFREVEVLRWLDSQGKDAWVDETGM